MRTGAIALQIEQQLLGGRHSAKTQYQLWLRAFYKGIDTQKGILARNHEVIIKTVAAYLRERISQDRIPQATIHHENGCRNVWIIVRACNNQSLWSRVEQFHEARLGRK